MAVLLAGAMLLPVPRVAASSAATGTPVVVESFDGTRIATVVYVPEGVSPSRPAPAILAGHHGGGPEKGSGDENPDPDLLSPTLQGLLSAGFVVQTWAARGFAPSEGQGLLNSPAFEVRDVQALLDYLATRDDVVQDSPGDPRVGMVGASYGGWIQLLVAERDARVDAISPRWTLYDAVEDVQQNGVLRTGWTAVIDGLFTTFWDFHEDVHDTFREALANGALTASGRDFLGARSAEHEIDRLSVPTLLIQSVSDTLTIADNAIAVYQELRARRVPVQLYLHCGGHTQTLLVDSGDGEAPGLSCDPTKAPDRIPGLVSAWMTEHLVKRGGGRPGSSVLWELQDGDLLKRPDWSSVVSNDVLRAHLSGARLVSSGAPYEDFTVAATPSPDGFRVPVAADPGQMILGSPRVWMSVTGSGREAFVFSKLLDLDTRTGKLLVIDEQATPMRFVNLSGDPRVARFDMAAVSWELQDGHKLLYEVSSTSNGYAAARAPSVALVSATVTIPLVATATR